MDNTASQPDATKRIDLTRQTDVLYWCRVLDVSMDQLRDAVHHAGHQVDEVQRYLQRKQAPSG